MEIVEVERVLDQLVLIGNQMADIFKIAHRNRKSLNGDNHYGHKFHDGVVRLTAQRAKVWPVLSGLGLEAASLADFENNLNVVTSHSSNVHQRNCAVREIKLFIESAVKPRLHSVIANPVPDTEQVLPLSVIKGTKSYLEKIVTQGNGCYEHQWFDACSVMIRRFVETLIVELFESRQKATDIKDANGDFMMLNKLIDRTLAETTWNLSRETKRTLPLVKTLGDRSAHNRRYLATKQDVDNVVPGLRVLADDLLHLAGLK